jgi:hypothetical protein
MPASLLQIARNAVVHVDPAEGGQNLQGPTFNPLRFEFFHQFFHVHEDTVPDFSLALNFFGAFVSMG